MSHSFKAFFLRRRQSEKMLMTAFVAVGLVIWISSFWTRASVFTKDAKDHRAQLKEQKTWLDMEPQIEEITSKALSTLQPEKSLSSSALVTRLDSIRSRVGLTQQMVRNNSTGSQQSPQFTVNNAQVQITGQNTKDDWGKIQQYYTELLKESPYITLQGPFQAKLTPGGRGGGSVSAVFNVSSVEMKSK